MICYAHHAALNLGVAISALWWGALPPWWSHTPDRVADLSKGSLWAWFAWGLGIGEKPGPQAPMDRSGG